MNHDLIESLQLPKWVFHSERNFREFATNGQMSEDLNHKIRFSEVQRELFWRLFDFINEYFEMDMVLFTEFEKERKK